MDDPSLKDAFEFEADEAKDVNEEVPRARQLDADAILDTLVPTTVDWRGTVGRHPVLSVVGVGIVGYLVGRSRGSMIMTGVSAAVSSTMMRQLGDVFDGDLFDF